MGGGAGHDHLGSRSNHLLEQEGLAWSCLDSVNGRALSFFLLN